VVASISFVRACQVEENLWKCDHDRCEQLHQKQKVTLALDGEAISFFNREASKDTRVTSE
jgi:hypothetical protein